MSRLAVAIEMLLVFAPAAIVILFVVPVLGDNPMLRMGAIWTTYLLMLAMVYFSLRRRGLSWLALGLNFEYGGWRLLLQAVGQSVVVFILAVLGFAIGAIVMANIVGMPEAADFESFNYLKDNLWLLAGSLAGVYVSSSFGEEVLYRGYLMTRSKDLLGDASSWTMPVMISTFVFAIIHYDWGIAGVVQSGCMGLVLALAYLKLKRNLWVTVLAHAYMDTILLVQLYLS